MTHYRYQTMHHKENPFQYGLALLIRKNRTKNDALSDNDNESQKVLGDTFSTRIDIL